MEDTFGPISETPLAFYDHDTLYWRMSQGTLAWVPPQSLEILPPSGTTQNGQLFERPTLGHHINVNAGFVSLPTPTAQAAKHGATQDVTANSHGKNLWDIPYLLPTPTARDWKDSGDNTNYERQAKKSLLAGVVMTQLFDGGKDS